MKSSISRVVSLFGIVALGVMMLTGLMCIAPAMRTAAQKYYEMCIRDRGTTVFIADDIIASGESMLEVASNLKAVSYTHLDVYKRQAGSMGKDGGVREGDPFGKNGRVLLWREPCRGTDLRPAGRGA